MMMKKKALVVQGMTVVMKNMEQRRMVTAEILRHQIRLSSLFPQVNTHWMKILAVAYKETEK